MKLNNLEFILACKENNLEKVKLLLGKNIFHENGFIFACGFGFLEIVKQILKQKNIINHTFFDKKETGIMIACIYNKINIIEELLKYKELNINYQNKIGNIFIYACTFQRIEILKLLLNNNKINLNIKDNCGKTGFMLACDTKNTKIINILLNDFRINVFSNTKLISLFNNKLITNTVNNKLFFLQYCADGIIDEVKKIVNYYKKYGKLF